MKPPDPTPLADLVAAARAASLRAYAPYSGFRVGAAVLAEDGSIHAAANVENASYGLTSCAERNAVFAAVSAGARRIVAVAIHTPTARPVAPCGACRQVISEFGSGVKVVSTCESDERREWAIEGLLPDAFGPHSL